MNKILILLFFFLPFFCSAQYLEKLPKENNLLEPHLLREDFRLMYEQLQQNHSRLYGNRTREDADRHFRKINSRLNKPMDRMSFYRTVVPFISEFRDGHTSMSLGFDSKEITDYETGGGKFFPLEVIIIDKKLYFKDNPFNAGEIVAGKEIVVINGRKVSQLIPELNKLISSDGEANANANTQRLFGYVLWLAGIEGNHFDIKYASNGKLVEERLPGISKEELFNLIVRSISPGTKLRVFPDASLAVVEIHSYGNVLSTKKFIDSSFQVIKDQGIKNVALDLRKNGGGSSSVGDYFLAHVTKEPYSPVKRKSWRFGPLSQKLDSTHYISRAREKAYKEYEQEGEVWHSPYYKPTTANIVLKDSSLFQPLKLFLFTSARTYSSAHMTALSVKCANLGTIIGQPTGERLNLTGETMEFRLPNSGLAIYIPAAAYEASCGDGNTVGVQPDHFVSYTLEDLKANNDPELSFLLELLKKDL